MSLTETSALHIVDRALHERCVKSVLEFLVLRTLEAKPMCGYDLIRYVHKKYNVLLSPGSVYPLLRSMERDAFIEGAAGDKRKVYRLTRAGREAVRFLSDRYTRILALTRLEEAQATPQYY